MKSFCPRAILPLLVLLLLQVTSSLSAESLPASEIKIPRMIFAGVPVRIGPAPDSSAERRISGEVTVYKAGGGSAPLFSEHFTPATPALIKFSKAGRYLIKISAGAAPLEYRVTVYPGFLTILPPLVAIFLALAFRQVLPALFIGIWFGATLIHGFNPWEGLVRLIDTYLVEAMTNRDHVRIIVFSMTLGGMVGLITRCGGAVGLVELLSRLAVSRRMSQFTTWLIGLLIFFDDYSNTLMVGNTMRPFTDRMKVSREKLSFIVDSTAAPVTGIALISTWIGYELALLSSSIDSLGIDESAYWLFIKALPFNFYCWACILFVLVVILSGRDWGPMYLAEKRALETGRVLASGAQPLLDEEMARLQPESDAVARWYNALLPIGMMSLVLIWGLYRSGTEELAKTGGEATLYNVIGSADPFKVLLWAAFAGVFTSLGLIFLQRLLNLRQAMEAFLVGTKSLVLAMIILTLARIIQIVCTELQTASYMLTITSGLLSPGFLPAITFILAALTSFSTGTSWGTMAILMPLIIPLSYHLPSEAGLGPAAVELTMLGTVGAVLSGSVFGDHCSPISDTTIMSSMSSGADHIDHVRTQLPYAIAVGLVSAALGYFPAGMGWINPYLSNILAILILWLALRFFGSRLPQESN